MDRRRRMRTTKRRTRRMAMPMTVARKPTSLLAAASVVAGADWYSWAKGKTSYTLNFRYGSRADHGKNILYIINPYFLRAKLLIMVRQVRVRKGERILVVGFLCTVYNLKHSVHKNMKFYHPSSLYISSLPYICALAQLW